MSIAPFFGICGRLQPEVKSPVRSFKAAAAAAAYWGTPVRLARRDARLPRHCRSPSVVLVVKIVGLWVSKLVQIVWSDLMPDTSHLIYAKSTFIHRFRLQREGRKPRRMHRINYGYDDLLFIQHMGLPGLPPAVSVRAS